MGEVTNNQNNVLLQLKQNSFYAATFVCEGVLSRTDTRARCGTTFHTFCSGGLLLEVWFVPPVCKTKGCYLLVDPFRHQKCYHARTEEDSNSRKGVHSLLAKGSVTAFPADRILVPKNIRTLDWIYV